jgi:hypothetical protein
MNEPYVADVILPKEFTPDIVFKAGIIQGLEIAKQEVYRFLEQSLPVSGKNDLQARNEVICALQSHLQKYIDGADRLIHTYDKESLN